MNTEPITLSPAHSARLRALHHLVPFYTMDELIENLIFVCSADNYLENMKDDHKGPQLRRIESCANWPREEFFENWDDLVEAVSNIPAYRPEDYPAPPEPTPQNIIPFEVIK